jgi:hypothetical protein
MDVVMAPSTATQRAAKRLRNGGHNSIRYATNCSNCSVGSDGCGEENQFPIGSCVFWDFPFPDAAPDAFATRGENLDFISAYGDLIAPPTRCGVAVTAGRCRDGAPGWRRLDHGLAIPRAWRAISQQIR